MSDALGEATTCDRCGHASRQQVDTTTKLVHAVRRKTPRVQCGEPTDHGWPCQCRSRFHAT